MIARLSAAVDPLVRLLLLAIVLAAMLPVTGKERAIAGFIMDAAIFLLFLINGLRLPRDQVFAGLRHLGFLLPLIIWVFGVMGLAGLGLATFAQDILPASLALGFVFLGVLPSTVQSATAYSSIAGGNVANSVIAAALLNILGVFITAPLLAVMAASEMPAFDWTVLERIGMILLLPFILGQVLQHWLGNFVVRRRAMVGWMDRIAIAIAVYVSFSSAIAQGLWTMLDVAAWGVLCGLIAIFLLFGFIGAWSFGKLLRLDRPDRISFLFAGSQKSIAMGAPLAAVLFPPAIAGPVLLPVLIYHLVQLVISAPLASRLSATQMPLRPASNG